MYRSNPPHHFIILGSVSIFKCDDLSALQHLCMGPSTRLLYPGFSFNMYSILMTFLHLNISASHPPNLKSAKIVHQNRPIHSCVAPTQPFRYLYELPIKSSGGSTYTNFVCTPTSQSICFHFHAVFRKFRLKKRLVSLGLVPHLRNPGSATKKHSVSILA